MKSMIVVLSPRESRDLLNGDLSVLVRKRFPKDYVGWVYVYCTKGTKANERLLGNHKDNYKYHTTDEHIDFYSSYMKDNIVNGKVVARFWCDKVYVIYKPTDTIHKRTITFNEIMKKGCLTKQELTEYRCKGGISDIYAIHITKLEIFDKPKELSEFGRIILEPRFFNGGEYYEEDKRFLTRAPRSGWCYVEV